MRQTAYGRQGRRDGRQEQRRIPRRLRERPLTTLITAAALLWLAWEIVSGTAADGIASSHPQSALAWDPDHAGALVALAESDLGLQTEPQPTEVEDADAAAPETTGEDSNGDTETGDIGSDTPADETVSDSATSAASKPAPAQIDAATALAGKALRENPLMTDALRALALAAEAKGDGARATTLMNLAATRARRDTRVEAWLLRQRFMSGDIDGAVASIDAMLRTWPNGRNLVLPILAVVASDVEASKPLIALLDHNPPWRSWFVTAFPRQTKDPQVLEAFFSGLQSGKTNLSRPELKAFLDRLIALGEYEDAYANRIDNSPPEWVRELGNVNNGGFESAVDGLPFDWQIQPVRGADTQVDQETRDNRALHVEFQNTRVAYRHVYQLLLLGPGAYELSGRVRARTLQNDRGLEWTVSCFAKGGKQIAETERTSGTVPWTTFSTKFEVPDSPDCRMQVLRLVLPARVPAEENIAGDIWYDDLEIARATDVVPSQ